MAACIAEMGVSTSIEDPAAGAAFHAARIEIGALAVDGYEARG